MAKWQSRASWRRCQRPGWRAFRTFHSTLGRDLGGSEADNVRDATETLFPTVDLPILTEIQCEIATHYLPNTLHHGPAELTAAHVLDCGVQCPKNLFANVHDVVNLARPFDGVIPHMPHRSLAVVPCVVQMSLYHFTNTLE